MFPTGWLFQPRLSPRRDPRQTMRVPEESWGRAACEGQDLSLVPVVYIWSYLQPRLLHVWIHSVLTVLQESRVVVQKLWWCLPVQEYNRYCIRVAYVIYSGIGSQQRQWLWQRIHAESSFPSNIIQLQLWKLQTKEAHLRSEIWA